MRAHCDEVWPHRQWKTTWHAVHSDDQPGPMTPYLLLLFAAFGSATLIPGFSEAGVAAMVVSGHSVVAVVAVAALGNTLGSAVNWVLGRYLLRYADRQWFPLSAEQLERGRALFNRYGLWSLLFAWVPVVGDPLTLVAGVARVRFDLFILLVGIGKLLRYVFVALAADVAVG